MATGDVETESPLPVPDDLDDNGFPTAAATSSSFADDFYRSGIDWSSLQAPPQHQREVASGTDAKGGGSLVQRSLFQAWGIEKPPREEAAPLVQRSLFQAWGIKKPPPPPPREEAAQGFRDRSRVSSPSPSSSRALSGKKRQWGGSEENGAPAARKPTACPFYKKIPGKGRSCTRY
jgi:DNA cross-link repair 1A protein